MIELYKTNDELRPSRWGGGQIRDIGVKEASIE